MCYVICVMLCVLNIVAFLQKHHADTKSVQGSNSQGGQVEQETKPGVYKKDNN